MITDGFYDYKDTIYGEYQTPKWLQGTTHDILGMLIEWEQYFDNCFDDDFNVEETMIDMGKGGCYNYEYTPTGVKYGAYEELESRIRYIYIDSYTLDMMERYDYHMVESESDKTADMIDIWKGGFYDYVITENEFTHGNFVPFECITIEAGLKPFNNVWSDSFYRYDILGNGCIIANPNLDDYIQEEYYCDD